MISSHTLQTRFLLVLPRIKTCAQFRFRDIKCADTRADRIAEVIALACYADRRIMWRLRKRSSQTGDILRNYVQFKLRTSP
jgi:hypothetical protein